MDSLDDSAQPSNREPGDSTWHKGWSGTDWLTPELIRLLAHHSRLAVPSLHSACSSVPSPVGCLLCCLGQGHWFKAFAAVPHTTQGLIQGFATGLLYWRVQRCNRGLCRLEEVRLSAVRSLLARITGVSNLPKKIQLCQGGVHRRGARQRQM